MSNKGFDYYNKEKEKNEKLSEGLKKDISIIGYVRLADFVIGLITSIYTYYLSNYTICAVITVTWIGLFIYLMKLHEGAIEKKKFIDGLVTINKRGIDRIKGGWNKLQDDGKEFLDLEHPYCGDLDIMGHSSLFQWINTSVTYLGRLKFKDYLLQPLKSTEEVKNRQEAVKELSQEIQWRQQLNAEGMLISDKSHNPEELLKWAGKMESTGSEVLLKILINVLTVAIFTTVFLVAFTDILSYKYLLGSIVINILFLGIGSKDRNNTLDSIHKYKNGIKIYEKIIKNIEDKDFTSNAINQFKKPLTNKDNGKASTIIGELKTISDFISDRANMAYIVINVLFLWDYRCLLMLKKWKVKNGIYLKQWLDVIAEMEALSSLSNIAFENDHWCFPEVNTRGTVLKAEGLGHPLLGEKRVCNDINIKDKGSVLLITGSNMSGKSTFLRTVGINMVLASCGAPVCASRFSTLIMDIYTCMRVSDNLEKSISSFYAEILRIKTVVKASKESKRIFFLLDEIFKGTNSLDRHQGAKMLIKQLSSQEASGMVSTHDLELGEMDSELSTVSNYHFQEHYQDGELNFDYKLKRGVSTTRNAMHLIKLAGIDESL